MTAVTPPPDPPPLPPAPYAPAIPPVAQALPKTWMNWVAFGCGLGVFVTCISGIVAIVFGHMGRAAAKRGEAAYPFLGFVGLLLGYLSLLVTAALVYLLLQPGLTIFVF